MLGWSLIKIFVRFASLPLTVDFETFSLGGSSAANFALKIRILTALFLQFKASEICFKENFCSAMRNRILSSSSEKTFLVI